MHHTFLGDLEGDDLELSNEIVDTWIQFLWSGTPGAKKSFGDTWQSYETHHEYLNITGSSPSMSYSKSLKVSRI